MTQSTSNRIPARYCVEVRRASFSKVIHFLWLALPLTATAASVGQECVTIDETKSRLECYDLAFGRQAQPLVAAAADDGASAPVFHASREPSPMSSVWELRPEDKRGTFRLLPHKTNYLLPIHYSTRINKVPGSPASGHAVQSALPLDATEAKFQLSFKVKAWENLLGDNGDVWFAYTQQSNWQLYSRDVSSPFRETDYEPELVFSLRTDADADVLDWRWQLLNLGFVHQSNGRPLPLSRSWNRVYAQFGFERGPFTLLARPWFRLPESASIDDNPDIRDYLGSGDLRLAYANDGHVFSVLGRYSAKGRRGGLQTEWAFPISGLLKGYVQLTNGYGASLIDYNHSQTTLGVGLLLLPWQ
ncbi:MAG TPA: phospholipase A [Rhodocyclaceae bacterium]|nr:phospholipase A [Rhodocyclaceae bacterium]